MKVLITIVLAIGSVTALGSGPYLPSGWKPQGPSFYLPSEVAKPDSPLKETLFLETEASGSDALREYGPPKLEEVVQVIANQGLPDVATEQTFYVQAEGNQNVVLAVREDVGVEENTEQIAAIVAEVATTTEAQFAEIAVEEQTTEILSEAQPTFEVKTSDVVDVVAEIVEQTSEAVQIEEATEGVQQEESVTPTAISAQEEIVVSTAMAQEDIVNPTAAVPEEIVIPTAVIQEEIVVPTAVVEQIVVERVAEVNNIAEALVNLEQEVKAAEAFEGSIEIKQETSGSLEQAPEGFLEYGPPGFREYGPPKQDELARSVALEVVPASAFENNEVRRRRFSPKFRSTKKH